MAWTDLNTKDRAAFIRKAVNIGITNVKDIELLYNSSSNLYAKGGEFSDDGLKWFNGTYKNAGDDLKAFGGNLFVDGSYLNDEEPLFVTSGNLTPEEEKDFIGSTPDLEGQYRALPTINISSWSPKTLSLLDKYAINKQDYLDLENKLGYNPTEDDLALMRTYMSQKNNGNYLNWDEAANRLKQTRLEEANIRRTMNTASKYVGAATYGPLAALTLGPTVLEGLTNGGSAFLNATVDANSATGLTAAGDELLGSTILGEVGNETGNRYAQLNGYNNWASMADERLFNNDFSYILGDTGRDFLFESLPYGLYGIEKGVTNAGELLTPKIAGPDGKIFNSLIVRKPENFYRRVGKDAIDDANKTGVIRGNPAKEVVNDSYPYFARSLEPDYEYNYTIEGTPNSADKWISALEYSKYGESPTHTIVELPKEPTRNFSQGYATKIGEPESNGFLKTGGNDWDFLREYEALPMTNGDVNGTPATNFVYYKKYPLFGWRQKLFKPKNNILLERIHENLFNLELPLTDTGYYEVPSTFSLDAENISHTPILLYDATTNNWALPNIISSAVNNASRTSNTAMSTNDIGDLNFRSNIPTNELINKMLQLEYSEMLSSGDNYSRGKYSLVSENDLGTKMPASEESVNIIKNSVVPRMLEMRPWMDTLQVEDLILPEVTKGYTLYPESAFVKAGMDSKVLGLHSSDTGNIAIKRENTLGTNKILAHEARHGIQDSLFSTEMEEELLNDSFEDMPAAYNESFGESENDFLKNYDVRKDFETTNLDSRNLLLGENRAATLSILLQNLIIDRASDDQIINAVRKSNGYGRSLIDYYFNHGGIPKSKVLAWRESMKKVGVSAIPTTIGASLLDSNNKKALGGNLFEDGGNTEEQESSLEIKAIEKSRNTKYNPNIDDTVLDLEAYKKYARALADYKGSPAAWNNKEEGEHLYKQMIGEEPSDFNYIRWYNMATPLILQEALSNGNGHWADSFGKTWLHPTVSKESPYNGYKNPYNPYGILFGNWNSVKLSTFNGYDTKGVLDTYTLSEDQMAANRENGEPIFDTDRALDELGYSNDRLILSNSVGKYGEHLATVPGLLPTIIVTPNGNYTELIPNKTKTGWVYKDKKALGGIMNKNNPILNYANTPNIGIPTVRYDMGGELNVMNTFKNGGQSLQNRTASKPKVRRVNIAQFASNIANNGNRPVNVGALELFLDSLIARGFKEPLRLALLATSALEMDLRGGASKGVGGNGYLGLSSNRMPVSYLGDSPSLRGKQIHYVLEDLTHVYKGNHPLAGNWSRAGSAIYLSGLLASNAFWNATNSDNATVLLNQHYIRPAGSGAGKNRAKVATTMKSYMKSEGGSIAAMFSPKIHISHVGLSHL